MKMNSTEWKWTKMALLGIRHTPAIILIPEHKPWHNNNSNAHCKVNQIMTNCAINIHFCTLVAKTHKVILCFYLSQSFYLKKKLQKCRSRVRDSPPFSFFCFVVCSVNYAVSFKLSYIGFYN